MGDNIRSNDHISRDVEFRAVENYSRKWVYGDLVRDERYTEKYYYIKPDEDYREVAQNTIGQYIGIKDNNRKKIYEGDIVVATEIVVAVGVSIGEVVITGQVRYIQGAFYIVAENGNQFCGWDKFAVIEVIGNIHGVSVFR